jgi:uncharacterized surface protein with fasciclin (FAS1) repeats
MKKSILIIAAAITIGSLSNNLFAQTTPRDTSKKTTTTTTTTTAKADTSAKDIDATITNVASLSTLTNAIKTANLNASLKGPGPFTVFAPDDAAFSAVPKTKLDSLMKDPAKLATLVNTHVVVGKYDKAGIIKALTDGKGTATLKTVDGQTLTLSVKDKKLAITDSRGSTAEVTSFDTPATNGVIHGINAVLQ